jgi:ABC-type branched-subunit amino acid transport system permease subunit
MKYLKYMWERFEDYAGILMMILGGIGIFSGERIEGLVVFLIGNLWCMEANLKTKLREVEYMTTASFAALVNGATVKVVVPEKEEVKQEAE